MRSVIFHEKSWTTVFVVLAGISGGKPGSVLVTVRGPAGSFQCQKASIRTCRIPVDLRRSSSAFSRDSRRGESMTVLTFIPISLVARAAGAAASAARAVTAIAMRPVRGRRGTGQRAPYTERTQMAVNDATRVSDATPPRCTTCS